MRTWCKSKLKVRRVIKDFTSHIRGTAKLSSTYLEATGEMDRTQISKFTLYSPLQTYLQRRRARHEKLNQLHMFIPYQQIEHTLVYDRRISSRERRDAPFHRLGQAVSTMNQRNQFLLHTTVDTIAEDLVRLELAQSTGGLALSHYRSPKR